MQWQPIETAPKDGTVVLVWPIDWQCSATGSPNTDMWICQWSDFYNRWVEAAGEEYFGPQTPTHWAPLPEPPKV